MTSGVHTSGETGATTPDYDAGYRAATENSQRDLVASLLILTSPGPDCGEVLSRTMARRIFTDAFGVLDADKVFGMEAEVDSVTLETWQERLGEYAQSI